MPPAVDVRLAIDGDLVASLSFANTSDVDCFLWRRAALLDGEQQDWLIRVRAGADELALMSPQRIRPMPAPAEFTRLRAGEALVARVPLIESYAWLPSGTSYTAVYECDFVCFTAADAQSEMKSLRSNEATFTR